MFTLVLHSAFDILQYQDANIEILAKAIPEPLGKLAQWRELAERLKIEGRIQGLGPLVVIFIRLFSKGGAVVLVCFLLLLREMKHPDQCELFTISCSPFYALMFHSVGKITLGFFPPYCLIK